VTVTNLMLFMLVSQILLAGYLLYSFNDVERESRRRQDSVKAHVTRQVAELERRLATGTFRSPEELNRLITADTEVLDDRRSARRPGAAVAPGEPIPRTRV